MKILTLLIVLIVAAVVVGPHSNQIESSINNLIWKSPCDNPIHWKIESVDPRFNLTADQFKSDINQGAEIWSKVYMKNLFVYDSQGQLSLNMIFDERQSLNTQINQLQNDLNTGKNALQPKIDEYKQMEADFKSRLANLNSQINYWNSRGGAPQDVYNQLTKESADLRAEGDNLNTMAKSLNLSVNDFNSQVGELNQKVETLNADLSQKPEEGLYLGDKDRIEIYFNVNKQELVHTIAHELGHSLGMEHVGDKNSIMYAYTTNATTPSKADISELQRVCKKQSVMEILITRFKDLNLSIAPQVGN